MFSKKKRALLIALVLSMVVGVAGCGNNASTETSTKTPSASDSTEKMVKLTYVIMKPNADESNQVSVEAALNKELKDKLPNTEIHFKFIEGSVEDYNNKINLMFAAGEEFDLCMANSVFNPLSAAVAKKNVIPLDDLLNKYAPDILKTIEAKYWPAVTFGGKIYSIPHPFVYAQPSGFVFNADLVDKYKFDSKSVKTVQDLEPFFAKLKANEKGITPFLAQGGLLQRLDNVDKIVDRIAPSINYDINDNTVKSMYDDKEMIANWKTMVDYLNKGYISKDRISVTDEISEIKTGKYAVMIDPGAYDPTAQKSTKAYGFRTYESLFTSSLLGTAKVTAVGSGISSTSKNPERAMMFQNLLYKDKEFANHVAYGVEGQDYTVVSGQGTDKPVVKTSDNMKWAIWKCWIDPLWDQWGSNWNSYESLDFMKKGTDTAPISPILGFTFNSEPVKKELAQISSIEVSATKILTFGLVPGGDVDKYLADLKDKLKGAGYDKVLDEINKQIADWKKANGK
jgi:putative aldouronate transport system substrate-binding protein